MINKNEVYREIGGIRIGDSYWISSNATWPFAKLKVNRENLIINSPFSELKFKRANVKFIEKYQGPLWFLGKGIKINHNKLRTSKFIIFWSYNVDNLIQKLKFLGYKI